LAAIFDISLIRTWGSVRGSLVVLPDLENMGLAVGISFLLCIEAEIHVIFYLLPVDNSHLTIYSHPDLGEYPHKSHRVAGPRKCGYNRSNLVAKLNTC
jgi:hypothetical protein